jgi:DNA invertase Pin-like site-specific DNA recombinase
MTKAAIYARISDDRDGTRAGVERQLEDCRRLVRDRGWTVFDEYVDNDRSAWSGKERPRYAAMLADLEAGAFDALVVYHQDRLSRNPREFEEFLALCDRVGMQRFTTVCGVTDLGNSDGIMVARVFSALAANASDATSRRVRRANDERAKAGRPHGSRRPYGYEPDGMTVREAEAAVLRTAVTRLLAGESLMAIGRWLEAEQIPTAAGAPKWHTQTLRTMLMSPRIAGLRQHRGQVIGPAAWPAIITPEQHERIVALLSDPGRRVKRAPRRYPLSGIVRCGVCTHRMIASPQEGRRRYGCRPEPDHGSGCGHVYIVAEPLEAFIADAVLMRLDTPALADALAGRHGADSDYQRVSAAVRADHEHLDELAAAYAKKQINLGEWLNAKQIITDRLQENERALARLSQDDALIGLVGNGSALRAQWDTLNVTRQGAIIRAVLEHVLIQPANKAGRRAFDIDRVQPVWRV